MLLLVNKGVDMNDLKIGSKIKLIKMVNEPDPIQKGSIGTIISITKLYDSLICGVEWEKSERTLNVCLPEDIIEIVD